MKNNSTTNFIKEITLLALESEGWETVIQNGYIIASKDGEKDLIICCTARRLSSGKVAETMMINAPIGKVQKMERYLDGIDDDCVPCIAFGIIKYNIDKFEIAIVPVEAIKENAEKGGVYSITETGGYYYNYSKLKGNELPPSAILRKKWSADKK